MTLKHFSNYKITLTRAVQVISLCSKQNNFLVHITLLTDTFSATPSPPSQICYVVQLCVTTNENSSVLLCDLLMHCASAVITFQSILFIPRQQYFSFDAQKITVRYILSKCNFVSLLLFFQGLMKTWITNLGHDFLRLQLHHHHHHLPLFPGVTEEHEIWISSFKFHLFGKKIVDQQFPVSSPRKGNRVKLSMRKMNVCPCVRYNKINTKTEVLEVMLHQTGT